MRILFILPYIPYPLNSGGNQAVFNMIDRARGVYDVSVLFNIRDEAGKQALDALKKVWGDVTFYAYEETKEETYPVNQVGDSYPDTWTCRFFDAVRKSMERKINRRMKKRYAKYGPAAFMKRSSVDFVKEHSCLYQKESMLTPGFLRFVYDVARKGFDVIQTEFYEFVSLVYLLPDDVVKLFVQHEIRYVRNQNELALFQNREPADEWLFQLKKSEEIAALSHYDKIVVLTDVDRKLMQADCPNVDVYVSPAAVLPERHSCRFQYARDVVFVGHGSHFPNADALVWFCRDVLPLVRREEPEITVSVVGMWGNEIQSVVRSLDSRVCFVGFVDNLSSFLNGRISVVPVRIGSGMRMKLLDAFYSVSPVVTTTKGLEGIPLVSGEDCLVADTAEGFSDAIIKLVRHEELQETLANHALEKLSGLFDIEKLQARRMALYDQICQSLGKTS